MFLGFIAGRFLALIGHIILAVTILVDPSYLATQCSTTSDLVIPPFAASVACLGIELIGFIIGLSTFVPAQGIISFLCHSAAIIPLFYIYVNGCAYWSFSLVWFVFAFCCAVPFFFEVITWAVVLKDGKGDGFIVGRRAHSRM